MALVAPVEEGKVQSTSTTSTEKKTSNDSLNKEAFLQLLICEMQNQDPLEPTTNTEYISQLATFSSLEEMQNMASSMDTSRAASLVGQEVYIKSVDATTGETNYVHGVVDYIQMSGSKPMLSVNGNLYNLSDLDSVYDQTYSTAYNLAYNWDVDLNKLPAVSKMSSVNFSSIEDLRARYDKMDDYQKSFIASDNVKKLEEYEEQMMILKNIAEALGDGTATGTSTGTGTDTATEASASTGTNTSADSNSSSDNSSEELSDEQVAALTE